MDTKQTIKLVPTGDPIADANGTMQAIYDNDMIECLIVSTFKEEKQGIDFDPILVYAQTDQNEIEAQVSGVYQENGEKKYFNWKLEDEFLRALVKEDFEKQYPDWIVSSNGFRYNIGDEIEGLDMRSLRYIKIYVGKRIENDNDRNQRKQKLEDIKQKLNAKQSLDETINNRSYKHEVIPSVAERVLKNSVTYAKHALFLNIAGNALHIAKNGGKAIWNGLKNADGVIETDKGLYFPTSPDNLTFIPHENVEQLIEHLDSYKTGLDLSDASTLQNVFGSFGFDTSHLGIGVGGDLISSSDDGGFIADLLDKATDVFLG